MIFLICKNCLLKKEIKRHQMCHWCFIRRRSIAIIAPCIHCARAKPWSKTSDKSRPSRVVSKKCEKNKSIECAWILAVECAKWDESHWKSCTAIESFCKLFIQKSRKQWLLLLLSHWLAYHSHTLWVYVS